MRVHELWRLGFSAGAAVVILAAGSPAFAADPAPLLAQTAPAAQTVTVQGAVKSGAGAAVAGATVTLSGPATATATTDASGAFSVAVPPGLYRVDVTRGGFLPAALSDFAVVAGAATPLTVTLNQADLSSLRTIGTVRTTARGGSAINTGAAATTYTVSAAFSNLANPQVNDVLQRIPDVNIQHMGSQPDTSIILGGAQPYETQVLIDGHPLALGQYGVWTSQYFPSYLIGGVETQSGPGNTTPFANIAVGGTVNLLTPGFTREPTASFTYGADNYQTQYSSFIATGSAGRFGYVVDVGTGGNNGPYYGSRRCIVTPDNGGAGDNKPGNTGIVQYCGDASGSFFSKGELVKLKYDFTPTTSFEASFVGAWGGYAPQGAAWGTSLGPTKILPCLTAVAVQCTNPDNAYLVGSTINGYGWYTGSTVYNNQTLFDGQFRTSLGTNTLLVRPYLGNIEPEVILGNGQTNYPSFFGPASATSAQAAAPASFESQCQNNFFGSLTNPAGAVVTKNGLQECFQGPYTTYEQDKLYGTTVSFLHPFGDSLLNFTYDFHGQSTFAYINNPQGVSVPFSTDRYSTFSLTGDLRVVRNLGIDIGLYDTKWNVVGVKPASLTDATLVGFTRSVSRVDPHVALVLRPTGDVAYRASFGTSTTFPYVGQVSGLATYQQPAASLGPPFQLGGTLTEKNPNLAPEVSLSYGLGADKRFRNGAVLSADLQATVIHNVFEELTTSIPANGGLEGIFSPVNVARLRTQLATVKYNYAPRTGLGYNVAATAERSLVDGLPAALYSPGQAGFPVNNVQICGNGVAAPGIPTCIPYLKGYGQLTYTTRDGTFASLGLEYEGKNNSYFQPPFALLDLTVRRPVRRGLELQVAIQNLLNTNNYNNLATPNAGTPIVAGTTDGAGNLLQTSFVPTLVPAPPRTIRVQFRLHAGR